MMDGTEGEWSADFLVSSGKNRRSFFYAILDELEMPDTFLDSGMLSFRVT